MKPRIYADFNNLDDENRVRLNTRGSAQDLTRLGVQLSDGLEVTLYTDDADEHGRPDDLCVEGVVRRSHLADDWVAEVDWRSLRHSSDEKFSIATAKLTRPPGAKPSGP
jgi:hypothetical protein